jgi:hypothetical protein
MQHSVHRFVPCLLSLPPFYNFYCSFLNSTDEICTVEYEVLTLVAMKSSVVKVE